MASEAFDIHDLAEGAEIQRRLFNRITPPGISWLQPMLPPVVPFDAKNFDDSFLDDLLGEDMNSVAIYPLSLALDPKTRETLVYNADGKLIASIPADKAFRYWPEDADPARVTLQLNLLPAEDVEPYLYAEGRIGESCVKTGKARKAAKRSLGASEFGIRNFQKLSNGTMRLTVTNGAAVAEIFSCTVWHTSSNLVVSNETFTLWTPISPPFNGLASAWECRTTNLLLTNGAGVWEDANISSNARVRFYGVANRMDTDEDGLSDGAEKFVHHTRPDDPDTDGDGMLDGWEVRSGLNPLLNDSMEDPDVDAIPNVYEQFHETNPTNSDASSATILRVDPAAAPGSNVFSTLQAAFASSAPYSIIEVADGIYSGLDNTHLWFPDHPVMLRSDNGGASRHTVFVYNGEWAVFYLDAEQNSHTIIRGISLRLGGQWSHQYGFWLGPGNYYAAQGMGCAPFFDGVSVEMGESTDNVAFLCCGPTPEPIIFNNCIFRGRPGKSAALRGIYAMDSSALEIINCSFLDFPSSPYAYGIQLHSLYLAETGLVEIANCLWDSSFTASNPTPPFVQSMQYAGYSMPYLVHLSNSILPQAPTWFPPDTQSNVRITNALVAMGGHLRPGSPAIDAGAPSLTRNDFEGQPRDASPDIGADEYPPPGTGDSDGDGLSDWTEVATCATDPYRADSDSDGIADGVEVAAGTNPADPWSYRFTARGTVTNRTGSSKPVRVCHRWGAGAWNTNNAVTATNGTFGLVALATNQTCSALIGAFCDYNTNGLPDATEPVYWKPLAVTGAIVRTNFLLRDFDGDLVEDWQAVQCGTSPAASNAFCPPGAGVLTNLLRLTNYNMAVGLSTGTNAAGIFAVTNVATNGSFAFAHVRMTNPVGSFCPFLFDDLNTNRVWNTNELGGWQQMPFISRTGHTHSATLLPPDGDADDMPDFWERRKGLNWTNPADSAADPDADGLCNIHEYWFGSNPWVADNTFTNTAAWAAIQGVDSKIAGRSPTNALEIFSVQNHAATNYVRNTNCWASSYDLTCMSPWNNTVTNGPWYRSCTLISPRHVIYAAHFPPDSNVLIRFVGKTNNVITRQIVAVKQHPLYNSTSRYPDIGVGLLNADVPTNQIRCAIVLPSNYKQHLYTGSRLPALRLNSARNARVGDISSIESPPSLNKSYCSFTIPYNPTRLSYYDHVYGGDSGNPSFCAISNKLVLLTVWTGAEGTPGYGTPIVTFKNDINNMMTELGRGYQLTEMDISGFQPLQ